MLPRHGLGQDKQELKIEGFYVGLSPIACFF